MLKKLVEKPSVTQLTFTCLKSTMEKPEQCVKSGQNSEAYLQPVENFSFPPITFFTKSPILDVRLGSKYTSL